MIIFLSRPLFTHRQNGQPTYLTSYLSQCSGCSVVSEGSGLSPRCVCSPCWSCSEGGGSRLILHTSPRSLPAANGVVAHLFHQDINIYKAQLTYLSADQALLKVFL